MYQSGSDGLQVVQVAFFRRYWFSPSRFSTSASPLPDTVRGASPASAGPRARDSWYCGDSNCPVRSPTTRVACGPLMVSVLRLSTTLPSATASSVGSR